MDLAEIFPHCRLNISFSLTNIFGAIISNEMVEGQRQTIDDLLRAARLAESYSKSQGFPGPSCVVMRQSYELEAMPLDILGSTEAK